MSASEHDSACGIDVRREVNAALAYGSKSTGIHMAACISKIPAPALYPRNVCTDNIGFHPFFMFGKPRRSDSQYQADSQWRSCAGMLVRRGCKRLRKADARASLSLRVQWSSRGPFHASYGALDLWQPVRRSEFTLWLGGG
jgi:hypothetical protein